MITFGLTGGIAVGKSTITKTFRLNHIPIVDADVIAHDLVVPGSEALDSIIDTFGEEYLLHDGSLDRVKLGSSVFSDPDLSLRADCIAALNSIMIPLIQKEATHQINVLHNMGFGLVGYDAPLLIEMGSAHKYRPLIVVSCPISMQIARLMSRNSLTHAEAMDRINAQMSTEEKIKLADYFIDTSGTIINSIKQTEDLIKKLMLLETKD